MEAYVFIADFTLHHGTLEQRGYAFSAELAATSSAHALHEGLAYLARYYPREAGLSVVRGYAISRAAWDARMGRRPTTPPDFSPYYEPLPEA